MLNYYPFNFGGIEEKYSNLDFAKYVILKIPYEATTTYGKGTKYGPNAIIEASRNMELLDDETMIAGYLAGIHTTEDILFDDLSPEKMVYKIYEFATFFLRKKKFLISIGGEHSISYPLIKAFSDFFNDFGILHIDAHLDLRESYEGTKYSHASVIRRISEINERIVSVGIRSISEEEAEYLSGYRGKIIWARDIVKDEKWIDRVIDFLPQKVYITFDIDGLDPSIIPSTGTPEPGGIGYYQILNLLKRVVMEKEVIGADFVEFAPIPYLTYPQFTISKIIYKLICFNEAKR